MRDRHKTQEEIQGVFKVLKRRNGSQTFKKTAIIAVREPLFDGEVIHTLIQEPQGDFYVEATSVATLGESVVAMNIATHSQEQYVISTETLKKRYDQTGEPYKGSIHWFIATPKGKVDAVEWPEEYGELTFDAPWNGDDGKPAPMVIRPGDMLVNSNITVRSLEDSLNVYRIARHEFDNTYAVDDEEAGVAAA